MRPSIFDSPEPRVATERRELHSRYLDGVRMYPKPFVLQWLKPAGSKVAYLINMEEEQ